MNKIAYFGGSFDPIHKGHEYIIKKSIEILNLDKLYILPNSKPPHKDSINATYKQRCNMIEITIKNLSNVEISYLEASNTTHYTLETVKKIRQEYKNDKIYFIIGEDSLINLDSWYRPREILKYVDFAVIPRENNRKVIDIQRTCLEFQEKYEGNIVPIDVSAYNISSTEIRNNIKFGKSIRGYVNEGVEEYILGNGLYIEK